MMGFANRCYWTYWRRFFSTLLLGLLVGCSNSGGSSGPSLQGGSIQGTPLSLIGSVSTLAGSPLDTDGIGSAARLAGGLGITSDGTYLYFVDKAIHVVRRVDIATNEVTTIAGKAYSCEAQDGIGVTARFCCPQGITYHGGNLYIADSGNHAIRKLVIATGEVSTIAGAATVSGITDGPGSLARFNLPTAITNDGASLFIADTYNHTIRQIDVVSYNVTTLAGASTVSGYTDGVGSNAKFDLPRSVSTDGIYLYVAEGDNNWGGDWLNFRSSIRRIEISSASVTTWAGAPVGASFPNGSVDALATNARFFDPRDTVTIGGYLYVADTGNALIRRVDLVTAEVTTLAGAVGELGTMDGIGESARFRSPRNITTDGVDLYVFDETLLRKIAIASGQVATVAGGSPLFDGVGPVATFYGAHTMTTDGESLYLIDSGCIRKIGIATGKVITLAGQFGHRGFLDGIGSAAAFVGPSGITTDGKNLYVTDSSAIRKIVIGTGEVTTLAGSAGMMGSVDGVGGEARFMWPGAITTDGDNLYVVDGMALRKVVIATGEVVTLLQLTDQVSGMTTDGMSLYVITASTVRKIVIATGEVATLAGQDSVFGTVDGTGSEAHFSWPQGITTDGENLYLTESTVIRRLVIASGEVTTMAGLVGSSGSDNGVGSAARFVFPNGIGTDGVRLFVVDNNTIRTVQ